MKWLPLILLFFSCAVCRHEVLTAAAVTEEWGKDYKIIVYETYYNKSDDGGEWGHAQVKLENGKWVCNVFSYYTICDGPDHPITGRSKSFTPQEWLTTLRKGRFIW